MSTRNTTSPKLPSQTELFKPLLEAIHAAGGAAKPSDIYNDIAERIGLDAETRAIRIDGGKAGSISAFERSVRWTKQRAVAEGLVTNETRNRWELTDKANEKLGNIIRGAMLTIFTTNNGLMLWANCEDAVGLIDEGSVSLLLSSPPYPILRQKAYQRGDDHSTQAWTEWMLRLCEQWAKMLTPTGSMMLNLGTVWEPGMPAQSLYIERLLIRLQDALGFHLLQRLDWHSPSKLPSPAEWVTIRKLRVKPSVEPILWLSQNPFAHGDNRNVLVPYSKSSLRALANPKTGVQTRPSGHTFGAGMFVDNGGAIPPSLISASNTASASKYRAAERAAGRKSHPAMMPDALAEFGIKLATQLDDLVYDPFSGAGTVALAAEKLGRRWIGTERSREYITSSGINFTANGISINNLIAA